MNTACSSARKQVTVLGINSLYGKIVSFLIKQSPIANRLVLYDERDTVVAHDIAEIPTPCKVVVYNGEEQLRCAVKNSDVILIGDRDDCPTNDAEILRCKAAEIVRYAEAISCTAPNAIVLIAATPLNSMLPVFTEAQMGSGTLDCDKVMGVTSSDTMRASTLLARHLGIAPEKAYLPVIGGSSADTRIPLFSQSRPSMKGSKDDLSDLTRVVKMTDDTLKGMLNRGEALNKAYATLQLIDSVMAALRGQRNISEIVLSKTCSVPNVDYFSLPVILGPRGIAHRFPLPALTERESILLDHAVKHIEVDKMKGMNALRGEICSVQDPDMTQKYNELINCYDKDFIGSLKEKFKLGGNCPEICKPSVEYKLLSKVKLKLPPESKPSEMPERSKFIEPDTPPQDGCCPLKLPCPPIPPIRGLNQIQAKHSCRIRSKAKGCKCFFPPVEKALVPCNLCPSNKPCVHYGEFKTFYEEHRQCCTGEENNTGSTMIAISSGTPEISSGQNQSIESVPVTMTSTDNSVKIKTSQSRQPIYHAVWEYPKREEAVREHPMAKGSTNNSAVNQDSRSQLQSTNSNLKHAEAALTSVIETITHSSSMNERKSIVQTIPVRQSLNETSTPDSPASKPMSQISNLEQRNQASTKDQSTSQHGPDCPFRCSTDLCLDVLAPKRHDENPGSPRTKVRKSMNAPTTQQISAEPKQSKRYNYSSGINFKPPQEIVEGIVKVQPEEEGLKSTHSRLEHACVQPDCKADRSALTHREAYGAGEGQKKSVNINYHDSTRPSQLLGQTDDLKVESERKGMSGQCARDENIKRRIYSTLKVTDNIEPDSTQSLGEKSNKSGFSLSRHFHEEPDWMEQISQHRALETSLRNSLLEGLREKAKPINANMELQQELRASWEKSNRKRRNDAGLGGLIDSINPASRLPKRLESRPKLRKSYQALRKMYDRPSQLGIRGKRGSVLAMPESDVKSLVVVNDAKESKRLTGRIDRIKEMIQEALKKIIYPSNTATEDEPMVKSIKQKNMSYRTQPAMKGNSQAKREFFVEMRKMDPAYRPTTRIYAAKCPSRLLYGDHPNNHTKMVTFNNVEESRNVTTDLCSKTIKEDNLPNAFQRQTGKMKHDSTSSFVFPEVPNFPELIPTAELNASDKEQIGSNENQVLPRKQNVPKHPRVRGDYVKHFGNQTLPKVTASESLKAMIGELSRNIPTPGTSRAKRINDWRYGMTSPNKMTNSKRH